MLYPQNCSYINLRSDFNVCEKISKKHPLQTITFCGGEVFALAYFPDLVNRLVDQNIFIQIITNGTIDKLDMFKNPNSINLIVSIDGLQDYHDANRGEGNFEKVFIFLRKLKAWDFTPKFFL